MNERKKRVRMQFKIKTCLIVFSFSCFALYGIRLQRKTPTAVKTSRSVNAIPNSFDNERKFRVLWSDDENCNRLNVRFGKNLRMAYLASFPRSGNTWMRYLMEAATGYFTSSVFTDKRLYKLGYYGEIEKARKRTTILTKTHGYSFKTHNNSYFIKKSKFPVVLLIRNVENTVLSLWNFKTTKRKTAFFNEVSNNSYRRERFPKFVARFTHQWETVNTDCLEHCKNLLVIFYEDLVKDTIYHVKRAVKFLGLEIDDERLTCLESHIDGPVKRNHNEVDPFGVEERRRFGRAMAGVIAKMSKREIEIPKKYLDYTQKYNSR